MNPHAAAGDGLQVSLHCRGAEHKKSRGRDRGMKSIGVYMSEGEVVLSSWACG